MTKYVEWVEPYWSQDESICVIMRVTVEDAIKVQHKAPEIAGNKTFKYKDDQEALDDFVCVRWGKIVEE